MRQVNPCLLNPPLFGFLLLSDRCIPNWYKTHTHSDTEAHADIHGTYWSIFKVLTVFNSIPSVWWSLYIFLLCLTIVITKHNYIYFFTLRRESKQILIVWALSADMFTRTTNSLKVSGLRRKKETQANLKIWFWRKQQNQVNGQSLGHWNDPVIVVLLGSSSLITLTKGQNFLPLHSSISLLLCRETFGAYFECWILHISICYGLNCALPTHPQKNTC